MAGKSSAFLIFANLSGKAISEGLGCCLNSCSAVIPRFPGRFHRQIQYPARQRDEDIPSQIAIPRPICAHARIWLMKINRGIIIARQRESRGGNNLFSRYNTPAAIPSRATVNWACDQHPIERQAEETAASSIITRVCCNKHARRGRFSTTNVSRKRTILQSWGKIDILNSASRIMQCWSYYVKINSSRHQHDTERTQNTAGL